ncbi:MAG: PLP-dependent transferase [Rubrivivax sp.]
MDSTVATPVLTAPLVLGADIVMHAATKYLNGHSDLIAGVAVAREDSAYWQAVRKVRAQLGARSAASRPGCRSAACARCRCGCVRPVLRPNESRRISPRRSARERSAHPGLPGAAGHEVAKRQMKGGFGGMLSIRVRGGEAAAIATAANVQLWKRATSLGGTESLVEHRASVEGAGTPAPADLLRLSVGLEHADDLIADLEQALARARA